MVGLAASPPTPRPTAPRSARAGPDARRRLPPLPGKPQIMDCTSSEPQHIFILTPRRPAWALLGLAAIPGVEGGEERGGCGCARPQPHPLAGKVLCSSSTPEVAGSAANPSPVTCLKARQPRGQSVIAENVPEPGFLTVYVCLWPPRWLFRKGPPSLHPTGAVRCVGTVRLWEASLPVQRASTFPPHSRDTRLRQLPSKDLGEVLKGSHVSTPSPPPSAPALWGDTCFFMCGPPR